jgi:Copper transport outer membrane protein, MctB
VIDFRYHLVSIVAVFLALAIGIVVGATALKPTVTAGLDRASRDEQRQINSQRSKINSQLNQINGDQAFAQAAAPLLLANLLTDQKVVLVTTPGASGSTISGITTALQQAGAKVTGQVQLQPAFFDTGASTENNLEALAQRVRPPGVTLGAAAQPAVIAQISGQQQAAQVIAPALVSNDSTDLPATTISTILDGFAQQGYLQVSSTNGSSALAQASLAVVVIPANPPSAGDSDPSNLALISLAEQLKLGSRGVVVAGTYPGSGSGSAIDELSNGNTGVQLSSVDNANYETGQIQVVQALNYLLAGHKPTAYGVYANAVPTPAPTPSPTASVNPASTVSPKPKSSA